MAFLVFGLLSAFMVMGVMPCHADIGQCQGSLNHTDCRCHSIPCHSPASPMPIAALSIVPYHPLEYHLTQKIIACSIFRPPELSLVPLI
jgi:hypothetical protein